MEGAFRRFVSIPQGPRLCSELPENILHIVMSQQEQGPTEELVELPLFPLNMVLFPGMPLPLHIFEERYKAMIGDCLEREEPFGIVLIKEGQEVGDPADPFRIGTTARIVQSERLQEGRMNILTTGESRFELVEITQRVPHLVAQVKYLTEDPGEDPSAMMPEVSEEYAAFLRSLTALSGGWTAQVEVPEDPVRLSFAVCASLATSIELPRDTRQELLEMSNAQQRLEKLLPLLKRGNKMLTEEVAKRNPFQGPRLN